MYRISPAKLLLLLAFGFLANCAFAASDPTLPKADEVLTKAIARSKWEDQQKLEEKYAFSQRTVQEKLDKQGKVTEHNEETFQPVLIGGKIFQRLVEKNGKPPSADDLKKQAEREKKFREAIAKKEKPKGDDDDDDDDTPLNEELVAKYNFAVIAREEINGRHALMLTFLPKTGTKLPEKKKMDRILNHLEGRVWFDEETASLLKLDMHLTEPTSLMGGLGNIRSLDFLMELSQVAPNVFGPKEINISFEGRKLFSSMHVKQKATFTDYRKISELAELKN